MNDKSTDKDASPMPLRSVAIGAVLLGLGFGGGFFAGKGGAEAAPCPPPAAAPECPKCAAADARPQGPAPHGSAGAAGSAGPTGSASSTPPVPASPEVIALLDGLKVGDDVAGWKVTFIFLPSSGPKTVTIGFEKAETRFSVSVAADGSLQFQTTYTTEKYALFYPTIDEGDAGTPEDKLAVVKAIQARVAKTEKTIPKPDAL